MQDTQERTFPENALLGNMVPLEMAGAVEYWQFRVDAIHVCLAEPRRCGCREMHFWFVNRDGVTRCVNCDEKYARDTRAKSKAEAA